VDSRPMHAHTMAGWERTDKIIFLIRGVKQKESDPCGASWHSPQLFEERDCSRTGCNSCTTIKHTHNNSKVTKGGIFQVCGAHNAPCDHGYCDLRRFGAAIEIKIGIGIKACADAIRFRFRFRFGS
jgi:hypothetical protein